MQSAKIPVPVFFWGWVQKTHSQQLTECTQGAIQKGAITITTTAAKCDPTAEAIVVHMLSPAATAMCLQTVTNSMNQVRFFNWFRRVWACSTLKLCDFVVSLGPESLRRLLTSMDGRGYSAYKDIVGILSFLAIPFCSLLLLPTQELAKRCRENRDVML